MNRYVLFVSMVLFLFIGCEKSKTIIQASDDSLSGSELRELVNLNMCVYDSVEFFAQLEASLSTQRIRKIYWGKQQPAEQFVPYDTIVPEYLQSGQGTKWILLPKGLQFMTLLCYT